MGKEGVSVGGATRQADGESRLKHTNKMANLVAAAAAAAVERCKPNQKSSLTLWLFFLGGGELKSIVSRLR